MSPNTTNTTNPPDTKYLAQPKTESSKKITKTNSSNHIEMYHFDQKRKTKSTLLVLIDFCPVWSELFTWSSVTKTFDILPEIIIEYQI
jgi:hypothetical protein